MNKHSLLNIAIKITEEHARSGNPRPVENVLEAVYNKLVELVSTFNSNL